ncbi:MAG: MBOAT family O-acyltransferase [Eubacteriales bacterium]|jgi:D-alanyl-lipoteichoic acid acyltransferase DltB (MBOAT superfamily)
MVFNSFEFLIFWPVVTVLYFVLPKKLKWIMLLLASYYFYVSWNFDLVFLILFTTVISYVSALIIEKKRENKALTKACLTVTLVASLGVLFFFKYFNFLSSSVTGLLTALGAKVQPLEFDLILPVGISFYTFQTLSYVIDVYRGTVKAERHFGYFALYVSFFPQLVAGPIERPENLLPQLHADNPPSWRNTIGGLRKMIVGFFKKVVVADMLAGYVNLVYNNVDGATGLGVVLATVMFAFQIYGDFAGYTDIAIGCAEIMGIKLMKNFNLPYTAQSIKEFWARWHISLSTWFRDYLYIPLGGNRCSKFRHQMNVMIVFLVSGLWHGAAWTFVIWGALHGTYQIVGYMTKPYRQKLMSKLKVPEGAGWLKFERRLFTFVLVNFAWIFFRANSFSDLQILIKKLFSDWSLDAAYFTNTFSAMNLTLLGGLLALFSVIVMSRLDRSIMTSPGDGNVSVVYGFRHAYVIWAVALAWMLLLVGDGASTFIYFQF